MTALRALKAKDVMKKDVVRFSPDTSIESALSTFEDLHISGAPVVDSFGKLVGVLSAFDVARREHLRGDRLEPRSGDLSYAPDDDEGDPFYPEEVVLLREDYSPDVLGSEVVGDWMSEGVVTVRPGDSLKRVCETMVEGHFHRVCVTEGDKLVGIVTSFDIVRTMAEGL
jgi:CBS domain-containing protein